MKPKDLKPPFTWNDRRVVLEDSVLYVPERCEGYEDFPLPAWAQLFGNERDVVVEYCSGNGDWIVNKAINYPEQNWIALEMRFDRVRKIWAKRENHGLKNLFIICGEAELCTRYYFTTHSISAAYINFPDPWPKARHAKHRLIQYSFVTQLARVLKKEAPFFFVTDDDSYATQFVEEVTSHFHPNSVESLPDYGNSWFEQLWRGKGRDVNYFECRGRRC